MFQLCKGRNELTLSKQLKINFDTNEIVEAVKENSLYNWCIKNNRKDLLDEWNYELNGDTNPKNITPKNGKKVWWICSVDKRHVWDAVVSHRTNGTGCPYCTGQKIKPGVNDLFTTNPGLKNEWDFDKNCDDPTQLSKGNDSKKYWWKCSKCGFEWDAVIYSRTTLHTGCPNCGKEYYPCPKCGSDNLQGSRRCVNCGQSLQAVTTSFGFCPRCGAQVSSDISFCPRCGNKLK